MAPDPVALAAFTAWCADGLADHPTIAGGDRERVCVRASEARSLLFRAYLAGWRRSVTGISEIRDTT